MQRIITVISNRLKIDSGLKMLSRQIVYQFVHKYHKETHWQCCKNKTVWRQISSFLPFSASVGKPIITGRCAYLTVWRKKMEVKT